jgi:hypothetical protein
MKNQNVTPARAMNVKGIGNPVPLANMPADNVGNRPVKLGAGQKSSFGNGVSGGAKQAGATQPNSTPKANMPANNTTNQKVSLGNTMHGVGKVPGYLRNK